MQSYTNLYFCALALNFKQIKIFVNVHTALVINQYFLN